MNFHFVAVSFVCVLALSQSTKANVTVSSVQEQIKFFTTRGSLSNLVAIEITLEPLWTSDPSLYFQSNGQLIDAMATLSASEPLALQEYEKQSRWVLSRKCPTNPPDASICFNAKFQIAKHLVDSSPSSISNAVVLAEFLGEVRTTIITNYHRAKFELNVMPPLTPTNANGMGYMSGMNPESISDPVARAAYVKVLEENDRRREINEFQINTLPEINRTMTLQFFYYISRLSEKETMTKKQAVDLATSAHLSEEEQQRLQ